MSDPAPDIEYAITLMVGQDKIIVIGDSAAVIGVGERYVAHG